MSSRKIRKPKGFKLSTEIKRRARFRVGAPPAEKAHTIVKRRPPKHKKRDLDFELI